MKKFILAIFLILGVVSFSAPKYVDMSKLQKNSYEVLQEENDAFIFGKSTQEAGITVAFFNVQESKNTAKQLSEDVKITAPDSQKYLSARESKRAYILKFKGGSGYTYSFVAKQPKVKNCYISVLYTVEKELKDNELDKTIDKILDEAESFLK